MNGKLIVIEGIDGSGKTTQLELLKKYLHERKVKVGSLKFPQYKNTFFGKTIAQFLRGELAALHKVDPYLLSMVYAMDRAEARDKMYRWLNDGRLIVLDRYVSSNMAHQCGRLPKHKRAKFLRWIDELEYRVNNVPREHLVIYLFVPYKTTQVLMGNQDRHQRKYAKGKVKDIVEENEEYLRKSEEVYLFLSKRYSHWVKVDCVDAKGQMRSREEIHNDIKNILAEKGILPLH
jgi:dTMP kinase